MKLHANVENSVPGPCLDQAGIHRPQTRDSMRRWRTVARPVRAAGGDHWQPCDLTRIRLARAPTTENAPPGEAGRFWGYYREERAPDA
jgi:hypothetical protein